MRCKKCNSVSQQFADGVCPECWRVWNTDLAGELAEAKQQLAAKTAECDTRKRIIERLPLCPDHRDKVRVGCVECENESMRRELAALREKAQDVVDWRNALREKGVKLTTDFYIDALAAHLSTGKEAIAKAEAEKPADIQLHPTVRIHIESDGKPSEPACTCWVRGYKGDPKDCWLHSVYSQQPGCTCRISHGTDDGRPVTWKLIDLDCPLHGQKGGSR